jgi:methyl-accepting chemotaxis protein
MATCMDKFARTFEASARRWELVVYPSMLAFIVLAAYGFFLIYSLSHDISRLARSMETVVVSMNDVSANMTALSGNVALMSGNMAVIAHEVGDESGTMKNRLVKMDNMNQSMGVIALPMYQMRDDMGRMSKNMNNVAGPMSIVNGVAPW